MTPSHDWNSPPAGPASGVCKRSVHRLDALFAALFVAAAALGTGGCRTEATRAQRPTAPVTAHPPASKPSGELLVPSSSPSPVATVVATPQGESVDATWSSHCREQVPPQALAIPSVVTSEQFWPLLSERLDQLQLGELLNEFLAMTERRGLDPEIPGLRSDFLRLRVLFEATRDGGFWKLRWDITDQWPASRRIWKAWIDNPPGFDFAAPSAVAECDELSALFALLSKRVGVASVGLYYPTWNHTIAAWAPSRLPRKVRTPLVLIPTTQIFLGCDAGFDQTEFVTKRTSVGTYPNYDIRATTALPAPLVRFLLEQVRAYGDASPALSALVRLRRAHLMGSSVGGCDGHRHQLAEQVRSRALCTDWNTLRHLASEELGHPQWSPSEVLTWLAAPSEP